jgi:hypothetical protein
VRIAFFALLFANLLFLGWAQWIDPPQAGTQDASSRLPRLKLVTDAPSALKPPDGAAQKMALREAAPAQSCLSVGPFNDMLTAARTARMLLDQGLAPQQRAAEGETLNGYWVYVGRMSSDVDVSRVVEKLEKSGFTDAHVMKESPEGRRVSVGLFSERARAERRADAVEHIGLKPEIAERKFPGTVYWVDVGLRPGMSELPTQGLLAEGGRVRVTMQPCPSGPARPAGEAQDERIVKSLPRTTVASAPKRP